MRVCRIGYTDKCWSAHPDHALLIRVRFLPGGTPAEHEAIKECAALWTDSSDIGVRFVFDDNVPALFEVRIGFNRCATSSWAYVGLDALKVPVDRPTINFGWDVSCDPGTVFHELGHVLGMKHEHQSLKFTSTLNGSSAPTIR